MRAIRDIHEITPWNQGLIIGIDEVGRGSVMGPVITCACLFETWDGPQTLRGLLNDSKKLSHTSRAKAVDEINKLSIRYAFGSASRNEIDSINISKATNLAMARALASSDATLPQLVIDIGSQATDLVITLGGLPHLTRSIPTGVDAIVRSAMQNLNIDEKQAAQFVFKFGMSKDKLEGQVFNSINTTVDSLIHEIDKSIKYFQTRYTGSKIDRMIVSGGASVIPELHLYLANKSGLNVEIGNAWRNVTFDRARQNELLAISNQFAVAVGLAERHE